MMSNKRNGSVKKSPSTIKQLPDGKELAFLAKQAILKNETDAVLPLLIKLLETNCRTSAAMELVYYYFQKEDIENFEIYETILEQEEKDEIILSQLKRMKLYLKVKVLNERVTRNIYGYYERQIIEYQEQERNAFIQKKRFPKNKVLEENRFFYFWSFEELIEKIQKNIKLEGKCSNYDALDSYFIEVNKVGIVKEDIANVVEVTTLRNTNHIIDMKPSDKIRHRRLLIPEHPIKLTMVD